MPINLTTLSIQDLYAHTIPLPQSGVSPVFSKRPSKIDDNTRSRFENFLRMSLSRQMLELHFTDPDNSAMYFEISSLIHSKKGNLKNISAWLAQQLFSAQTRNSSEGVLIVARATCNAMPALALLKVENEPRISHSEVGEGENFSFDLTEISTLGMDKKRIFKAALFVATKDGDGNDGVEIVASDHQASGRDGRALADFFLKDFLECTYDTPRAAVLRSVFDTIFDHISETEAPPEVKTSMANALLTAMDSADPTFNIDAFTSDHVPEEMRDALDARIKKAGIAATEVEKDVTDLADAKFLSIVLSNGMRVIGPKEMLNGMVSLAETDDGLQQLRIEGTIVKYKLRSRGW